MGISVSHQHHKFKTNKKPPPMERPEIHNDGRHVIDITTSSEPSSSTSTEDTINQSNSNSRPNQDPPSTSTTAAAPIFQHSFSIANGGNTRNTSFARRESGAGRRSPLNSGYWISIELVITLSQIIAAVVVLCLSRHELPQAPLFTWVIGYASGCVATLPLLFWRFHNRNQGSYQDPSRNRQSSAPSTLSAITASFTSSSNARTLEGDTGNTVGTATRFLTTGLRSARLKVIIEYFKMGLDCFFAVWFVVGNVWIFGGHSSSSDAPNLYRLCIVFLTFSCVGYAMPFILCATICCCLPCIISVVGFREDQTHNRGATTESINSLPVYKFKIKKNKSANDKETNLGAGEGGIVAAGTEKERAISGEDAVCCICLAKYANNDELRELPCSHFFHKNCVDKWLKINASCPLCKTQVGETVLSLQTDTTATTQSSSDFL